MEKCGWDAGAIALAGLRGSIVTLGTANALDAALRFFVPVALVRLLSVNQFGDYRLLWLAAASAMLIAPLGMPRSLQYFLPRHDALKRQVFIDQTFMFMLLTSSLAALLFLPSSPLLPLSMQRLVGTTGYLVSLFVLFWVASSLIEILPSALEKYRWQAAFIVTFSAIRTTGIVGTAWFYRDILHVVEFLLIFSIIKYATLLIFRLCQTGTLRITLSRDLFITQLKHAVPFGINGMLNSGRSVAEQWVVAIIFSSEKFAIFSVAASIYPLLNILKQTITAVTVPKMSRLHSLGKVDRLIELNNKGNVTVCLILYPLLAFLLVNAELVVKMLYTGSYIGSANIVRLYTCNVIVMAVEISSILIVYQQGSYVMRTSMLMITITIVIGLLGAKLIGVVGVALGGFFAVLVAAFRNYSKIVKITGKTFWKIQNWSAIGVILLASVGGSAIASFLAILYLQQYSSRVQLPTTLALTIILYAALIVLFRHGWLFAQFLGKKR